MKKLLQNRLRALLLLLFTAGMSLLASAQNPCNCPAPTKVKVNNITTTTAQVSWTPPPVSVMGYTVKLKNLASGVETTIDVGLSNPYTLTGLTPNTLYQVSIIANCSATCKSVPTTPIQFQTRPLGIIIMDVIVQVAPKGIIGISSRGSSSTSNISWSDTYNGTQYIKVTANNQWFWIKRKDADSIEILNPNGSGFVFPDPISAGASLVPVTFSNGASYTIELTSSGVQVSQVSSAGLTLQLQY